MPLFALVLRALAPLFLLIVLGAFLRRVRVLHEAHVPILNGLVINVTLPALIFLALTRAPTLPASDARLPLAFLLAEAMTMAAAYGLGRLLRLPRPARGALMIVGVFGNTAFLGYPITLSLVPNEFPQGALLDEFGCVIALYLSGALVGGAFGSHEGDWRGTLLRFARSPLLLSVTAALMVRLLPWPHGFSALPGFTALGGVFSQCLAYLSQGAMPYPASRHADQCAGLGAVRAERHGRASGCKRCLSDNSSVPRQRPPSALLAALNPAVTKISRHQNPPSWNVLRSHDRIMVVLTRD